MKILILFVRYSSWEILTGCFSDFTGHHTWGCRDIRKALTICRVQHHASFRISQAAATGTSRGCTDPGQYPPVHCECKLFSRVIKNIFTPVDSELSWSFSNNMSETHPDRSWYSSLHRVAWYTGAQGHTQSTQDIQSAGIVSSIIPATELARQQQQKQAEDVQTQGSTYSLQPKSIFFLFQ